MATLETPGYLSVEGQGGSPLTGRHHIQDVGEEVVVFRLGHSGPQLLGLQELRHQDAQAVQIRELGREDLEDGLHEKAMLRVTDVLWEGGKTGWGGAAAGGSFRGLS